MSSVERGTAFEDRVYKAIKEQLESGELGLHPSFATLHKNKGYYSRDRDRDIIVDISIEVWLPEAPNWSLLWVCECKDYNGSVPVDDIEEFKAKLDQITGANRKGVLATSGALQLSAFRYARSNGIGVIRLLPENQVEYVLYQSDTGADPDRLTANEVAQAILQPGYVGNYNDFFAEARGYLHDSWKSLLEIDLKVVD